MREAVFSSLGSRIEGACVADCFAGTGAYGLEAMSRGASGGLFIENSSEAVACLRRTVAAVAKSCGLKKAEGWQVLPQKIYALKSGHGPFDLVFIDPPYAMIESKLPGIFAEHITAITAPHSLVCIEMPGKLEMKFPGWECTRRLGKSGKDKPSVAIYARCPA
jgi:16S rRNA (guanine966-N2)-methyltransferase